MTNCAFFQRPIRFASGVFACLLLVALISRANAETPTRLDAIIGAGVLRVGLTEDYRPFSFADLSGNVEDIDVDMAMNLAQSLGVNPTNGLVDLAACAAIADELAKSQGHRPPVVVDNTMLGPMFQTPLKRGADIALCSLTKYVGGRSDLVGGSISGDASLVKQVMSWRSSIGTQLDLNSCWMLMRSLETLEIRMTRPVLSPNI
jgi:O-acetylhomoserine/O-acetylserine sulfhydrylase-like pyridoxal-dependent enzyme